MAEPTPRSTRRTTVIVIAVATVIAVVGIVLIARTGGPTDNGGRSGPTTTSSPVTGRCNQATTTLTPADYYANADVSKLPTLHVPWVKRIVAVDAKAGVSPNRRLNQLWPLVSNQTPDQADATYAPEGFPVNFVAADAPKLDWQTGVSPLSPSFLGGSVGSIQTYGAFAQTGPYPHPASLKIEGYPHSPAYDNMLLTVDAASCVAYEQIGVHSLLGYDTSGHHLPPPYLSEGGAVWDLSNPTPSTKAGQPQGVTASRVPLTPLVIRFDEVTRAAAGGAPIGHVVHWFGNFCRGGSRTLGQGFVWPARLDDCSDQVDADAPPYGAWFRLRADYPTAGLTPQALAVVRALQTHGLILGDGGGQGYALESAPCPKADDDPSQCWQSRTITQLKAIDLSDLQAVDTSSLRANPDAKVGDPDYWRVKGS